jgi:hypothetical protein
MIMGMCGVVHVRGSLLTEVICLIRLRGMNGCRALSIGMQVGACVGFVYAWDCCSDLGVGVVLGARGVRWVHVGCDGCIWGWGGVEVGWEGGWEGGKMGGR